jgi:hypothetical protein
MGAVFSPPKARPDPALEAARLKADADARAEAARLKAIEEDEARARALGQRGRGGLLSGAGELGFPGSAVMGGV